VRLDASKTPTITTTQMRSPSPDRHDSKEDTDLRHPHLSLVVPREGGAGSRRRIERRVVAGVNAAQGLVDGVEVGRPAAAATACLGRLGGLRGDRRERVRRRRESCRRQGGNNASAGELHDDGARQEEKPSKELDHTREAATAGAGSGSTRSSALNNKVLALLVSTRFLVVPSSFRLQQPGSQALNNLTCAE
jgi:hypothetical protein